MSILAVQNISKTFKKRQVVKGVSFAVESGQVVGLLGPNGAGKTTSFYMVVGLVKPDDGELFPDGFSGPFPINTGRYLGHGHSVANEQNNIFGSLGEHDGGILSSLFVRRMAGKKN